MDVGQADSTGQIDNAVLYAIIRGAEPTIYRRADAKEHTEAYFFFILQAFPVFDRYQRHPHPTTPTGKSDLLQSRYYKAGRKIIVFFCGDYPF